MRDWTMYPEDRATPACQAAAADYANFVLEHEIHHVTDIEADFTRWNQEHTGTTVGPVESCAETLDEAERGAAAQINELLERYWQQLQQTIYNTGATFHLYGDAIGLTYMDCSKCPK